MLTGKWNPMNASIQKFNQLVSETLAHGGENDEDWMKRVKVLYKTHVGGVKIDDDDDAFVVSFERGDVDHLKAGQNECLANPVKYMVMGHLDQGHKAIRFRAYGCMPVTELSNQTIKPYASEDT
nr:hypothetical protein [Tanacetum cinerariifolium]